MLLPRRGRLPISFNSGLLLASTAASVRVSRDAEELGAGPVPGDAEKLGSYCAPGPAPASVVPNVLLLPRRGRPLATLNSGLLLASTAAPVPVCDDAEELGSYCAPRAGPASVASSGVVLVGVPLRGLSRFCPFMQGLDPLSKAASAVTSSDDGNIGS